MKRVLALLVALALALSGCTPANQMAEEAVETPSIQPIPTATPTPPPQEEEEKEEEPTLYTAYHGDRLSFLGSRNLGYTVRDDEEAEAVLQELRETLGAGEDTTLTLDSVLSSDRLNCYVFVQSVGATPVDNGMVKLIANQEGELIGVVSSLDPSPAAQYQLPIDAAEAEDLVVLVMEDHPDCPPLREYTSSRFLPNDMDPALDSRMVQVWVVYTRNPEESERPYLAHYIARDGGYLYALPIYQPDSWEAELGYDNSYYFSNLYPIQYTQQVSAWDGGTATLTVPAMMDEQGVVYLCDQDRLVMMAEEDQKDLKDLEAMDNRATGLFPDRALWIYSSYVKVWDYFYEQGWYGPDGEGSPSLLLYGFSDENGQPVDNSSYWGARQGGWQTFQFNAVSEDGQALDVIAHEFVHCVTGSMVVCDLYQNDSGAINEAMSDILGELTEEQITGQPTDWVLGGQILPLRDLANPQRFDQPEYTWDLHYIPNVAIPTNDNDMGGTHANSSLLGRVAVRLYQAGMGGKASLDFWLELDSCLGPGTNYPDLAVMLPWLLDVTGFEVFGEVLEDILADTALGDNSLPDRYPAGYGRAALETGGDSANWYYFLHGEARYPAQAQLGTGLVSALLPPGDYQLVTRDEGDTVTRQWTPAGWSPLDQEPDYLFTVTEGETLFLRAETADHAA